MTTAASRSPATRARGLILATLCLAALIINLDVTIVNVALPQIQKAFGASLPDLQWVIDAYALTLAARLLTAGARAGRFGRRVTFAAGKDAYSWRNPSCPKHAQ